MKETSEEAWSSIQKDLQDSLILAKRQFTKALKDGQPLSLETCLWCDRSLRLATQYFIENYGAADISEKGRMRAVICKRLDALVQSPNDVNIMVDALAKDPNKFIEISSARTKRRPKISFAKFVADTDNQQLLQWRIGFQRSYPKADKELREKIETGMVDVLIRAGANGEEAKAMLQELIEQATKTQIVRAKLVVHAVFEELAEATNNMPKARPVNGTQAASMEYYLNQDPLLRKAVEQYGHDYFAANAASRRKMKNIIRSHLVVLGAGDFEAQMLVDTPLAVGKQQKTSFVRIMMR